MQNNSSQCGIPVAEEHSVQLILVLGKWVAWCYLQSSKMCTRNIFLGEWRWLACYWPYYSMSADWFIQKWLLAWYAQGVERVPYLYCIILLRACVPWTLNRVSGKKVEATEKVPYLYCIILLHACEPWTLNNVSGKKLEATKMWLKLHCCLRWWTSKYSKKLHWLLQLKTRSGKGCDYQEERVTYTQREKMLDGLAEWNKARVAHQEHRKCL